MTVLVSTITVLGLPCIAYYTGSNFRKQSLYRDIQQSVQGVFASKQFVTVANRTQFPIIDHDMDDVTAI
jgi:hypothetical protein